MIRFVLRFLGLLLLALGFFFLVYDGIRTITNQTWQITSTTEFWNTLSDRSLMAFQASIERYAGPDIWKAVIAPLLEQPAAALASILGVILIVIGRKKKPLIGYARD